MLKNKTIGKIADEIIENIRPFVFEVYTEECNLDVVDYNVIIGELSWFSEYDKYSWCEFRDKLPNDEGSYWLTVIDNNDERKVVISQWYNKNSMRFLKGRYKEIIAWKPCIFPEVYEEDLKYC